MKKLFIGVCLVLLHTHLVVAQHNVTLSGKVLDANSGEVLIGANVYLKNQQKGATTNQYGFYSLRLPESSVEVVVSYIGYQPIRQNLILRKDSTLTFGLQPDTLKAVTVREQEPLQLPTGFLNIPVQSLKRVPMLLGEPDLMKALAMTPGIMIGQEGSSGLYVRGSNPEQNLILLDEAPVYNLSHAFGFVSVFNPDAVKNIDVYKGGFPARYGGRLAAVLDVTMKEGNNQTHNRELAVGVLSSRFLAEGPLKKGRSSYLLTARQMNTGLVFLPQNIRLWSGKRVENLTNLWFYDINAKVNHTFGDKSQIYFSVYTNQDYFKNAEQYVNNRTFINKNVTSLGWGNTTASLRYNRPLTSRLFAKATVLYSRFNYSLDSKTETAVSDERIKSGLTLANTVRDWGLKAGLEYNASPSYTLRTGYERFWHRYHPGQVRVQDSSRPEFIQPNGNEPIYTNEEAAYIENDWTPSKAFRLNAGLRLSRLRTGQTTYVGPEPRLALSVRLLPGVSFKLGGSQMMQYMHQLTSNGIGIPNDIWVPVTKQIYPMIARQADAGLHWNIGRTARWVASVETYYKTMTELLDYPQGTDVLASFTQNWQDLVVKRGGGRAYGMETMVQKKVGALTGWLSYTYAVTQRRFYEINEGNWYPSRYDRRHNLAMTLNYTFNKRWSVSTNAIYQTGYAVTLPTASFVGLDGKPTALYTRRNSGRMPAYHRLDVGATYSFRTRRGREAAWHFGAYNIYNRVNPYYLEPKTVLRTLPDGNSYRFEYDRMQINKKAGIPILPYVSYQIKF